MRVTYDPYVDAAYICLREIEPGGSARTLPVEDVDDVSKGSFVLDFDKEGRLIGIEVLNASRALPKALLDDAEQLGSPRTWDEAFPPSDIRER